MKKRTGDPWMPSAAYGRRLPAFTINLLVRNVDVALRFYEDVLGAVAHYSDPDFAALQIGDVEFMLHADHTYDDHPWHPALQRGERRGLGAELRLLGLNPERVESRALAAHAAVVRPVMTRGHGWREVMIEDPDGYVWAVGVLADANAPPDTA